MNQPNSINMICFVGINQDIIQVNNHKNVKLLCQYTIDVALKAWRCIENTKQYYMIVKLIISSVEKSFPLVFFANSYPIIGTGQIKLGKLLSWTYPTQVSIDQKE